MANVPTTREAFLDWIASFSGRVGPEVFAGFGDDVQNARAAADDFEKILATHEKLLREWADAADFDLSLNLLLDILVHPPGPEFCNDFYGRFRDDFDRAVDEMIAELGKRHAEKCLAALAPLARRAELRTRVLAILPGLESAASFPWIAVLVREKTRFSQDEFLSLHDAFLTAPTPVPSVLLDEVLALIPPEWREIREHLEDIPVTRCDS